MAIWEEQQRKNSNQYSRPILLFENQVNNPEEEAYQDQGKEEGPESENQFDLVDVVCQEGEYGIKAE